VHWLSEMRLGKRHPGGRRQLPQLFLEMAGQAEHQDLLLEVHFHREGEQENDEVNSPSHLMLQHDGCWNRVKLVTRAILASDQELEG